LAIRELLQFQSLNSLPIKSRKRL